VLKYVERQGVNGWF